MPAPTSPSTMPAPTSPSTMPAPTTPPTVLPASSPVPQSTTPPPVLFFRGRLIQGENAQRNAGPQTRTYAQGNPMWNPYQQWGGGGGYQQWGPSYAYAQNNPRWNPWPYGPYNQQLLSRAYSQSYPSWNPWRGYAQQNERARIQNTYGYNK